MIYRFLFAFFCLTALLASCNTREDNPAPLSSFSYSAVMVEGKSSGFSYEHVGLSPQVRLSFSEAVNQSSLSQALILKSSTGLALPYQAAFEDQNKTILIQPAQALEPFSSYTLNVSTALLSVSGSRLKTPLRIGLSTGMDTTDKFPRINDEELLTLLQKQTFKYFWDFAHPGSGLARERNTSGDLVTSGGSGFGIMTLVTGVHRQFITRAEGLQRMQQIVAFLKNKAQRFHGAYPHWLNGNTGQAIAFSSKDNGADLVETSFLMQGLLTARQYFDRADPAEAALRQDINTLWREVEWTWFQKNKENTLYWHWSPNYGWEMNMPVRGYNEALITYVLAAASPTYPIAKAVYDEGWALNGGIQNNQRYYDILLPLGPPMGGPLFFSHYSFLGINPNGLSDAYADYQEQNLAHARINLAYCKANPKGYYGYGENCWGLTASDDIKGYLAHEPQGDRDTGVISPTAALASFPYTPQESMAALRFFYYKLGDKIWKDYGFVDAFSLHHNWYAGSFLAIDQGPIVVMVENYRSQLLWNLFMSCPEVKSGMRNLGFRSPYL